MDLIPTKFLLEMKSGRAHPHEIRSMAEELIKRREGKEVVQGDEDALLIKVPLLELENAIWRTPSSAMTRMDPGDRDFIRFVGGAARLDCVVYRVR